MSRLTVRGLPVLALVLAGGLMLATPARAVDQPRMQQTISHLEEARRVLQSAAPNKGGHRVRALKLIDEAIKHVKEGIKYADQHSGKAAKSRQPGRAHDHD